jgi:hypothetical protein
MSSAIIHTIDLKLGSLNISKCDLDLFQIKIKGILISMYKHEGNNFYYMYVVK